jgi:outer membrane receptor protein involved in Fe transport
VYDPADDLGTTLPDARQLCCFSATGGETTMLTHDSGAAPTARLIQPTLLFLGSLCLFLAGATTAQAESHTGPAEVNTIQDELITVGTRGGRERSAVDSSVPIDSFSISDLQGGGQTEVSRMLQMAAPSFNFSTSTVSDGTDIVRPATLRGMNPDQTLVLVNGKRRYNTALMHVNGSIGRGTSGVDLNAIPAASIERIEILRDGASAQYGSDAIAGVINIVMKDQSETIDPFVQVGQTYEDDGGQVVGSLNAGFPLLGGFINLTGETGYYMVQVRWPVANAGATDVTYTIDHTDGGSPTTTPVLIDHSVEDGTQWTNLGTFWFQYDQDIKVTMTYDTGSEGLPVVADAMRFIRVEMNPETRGAINASDSWVGNDGGRFSLDINSDTLYLLLGQRLGFRCAVDAEMTLP